MGGANIIGDGPLRLDLQKEILKNHLENKIELLGTKPQAEIPNYIQQVDVLILPSLYDGWGAVVNEALLTGCYVICSDAAGASDLIKKEERLGNVFHRGDIKQLADCIEWCNNNILEIRRNRMFRKKWAEEHIDGKVVARYMIDCLIKSMF